MFEMTENETKFLFAKYRSKQASTKGRKDVNGNEIDFKLSFDEYVELYKVAGVYPSRVYVLARTNDEGHYEIGNVSVVHVMENLRQAAGLHSDLDKKITQYCIDNEYPRRMVRAMIKRGELTL